MTLDKETSIFKGLNSRARYFILIPFFSAFRKELSSLIRNASIENKKFSKTSSMGNPNSGSKSTMKSTEKVMTDENLSVSSDFVGNFTLSLNGFLQKIEMLKEENQQTLTHRTG